MEIARPKPYFSRKIITKRKSKSDHSSKMGMAESVKAIKAAMVKCKSAESMATITADDSSFNEDWESLPSSSPNANQGLELSPSRLLHVAKLKCKFADIIFKANQKNSCFDLVKLQREQQRFAQQQEEELKKIEAQFNRVDLKRQEERKAARLLIEKMERSVYFDHLPDFKSVQDDEKTAQFMDFVRKELFMC